MHAYQPDRLKAQSSSQNAIFDFISENAALCSAALVSTLVIALISINAIWYQSGKHPSPMFSTRHSPEITSTGGINKLVADANIVESATKAEQVKTAAIKDSPELLREIQSALSVRGYYSGKLDGVYGSRTKKAITAFQQDHSMKSTGKTSVRLLTQVLLSASSRPQEVPIPKATKVASATKKVKTVAVRTETLKQEVTGLVAQIQSGLRSYGYDNLVVDGKMGQKTATAIQRFQLNYGMKITGEPSSRLLDKLREIGAYTQG